MEMLIEKTKETYYEALQNSSIEWHNDKSDYTSFVPTIERTLKELLEAGFIEKVGKGRATGYAKK